MEKFKQQNDPFFSQANDLKKISVALLIEAA